MRRYTTASYDHFSVFCDLEITIKYKIQYGMWQQTDSHDGVGTRTPNQHRDVDVSLIR